ncbi:7491_t:CDS:2 [Funneliformis caledonium]|uniref:7491_t:CDS:1 n=1 Tax=Funneliformis caledonium TaxID=1117310 RepID=A0A9N8YZZ0_9GLOM|nr:7491_t:CDS:2 [Funneliformis caledonium]
MRHQRFEKGYWTQVKNFIIEDFGGVYVLARQMGIDNNEQAELQTFQCIHIEASNHDLNVVQNRSII